MSSEALTTVLGEIHRGKDIVNPTNPTRRPVDSATPTPGPQHFGTWFGRWNHIYTATPTVAVAPDLAPTTALPKPGDLTVAA